MNLTTLNYRKVWLLALSCCVASSLGFVSEARASRPAATLIQQQKGLTVKGVVHDDKGEALIGATILENGTNNGTLTDIDGKFRLTVTPGAVLHISYIGYQSRQVVADGKSELKIILQQDAIQVKELVIVGYGVQKKESVVGSISTVDNKSLMKSGGVSNVGQALQGKVPGLLAMDTSGEPGANNPKLYIRGQSSWNGSGEPLVLVDGVERQMNDVNMNDVANISILKDASATAVYGVKGANGVILLTTKRGQMGKPSFNISANTIFKTISKVPEKYDSYDAMMLMNESIMNEIAYDPSSWNLITPHEVALLYRNHKTLEDAEKYPNVDWRDFMMKDVAVDYTVNASVSGGGKFAKYFCSLGYMRENDMVRKFNTGRGYDSETNYQRFNYRSNLDLKLTGTTTLGLNVSGIYALKKSPNSPVEQAQNRIWLSIYGIAPDLFLPRYSDGSFGFSSIGDVVTSNPLIFYAAMGTKDTYQFKINADVKLSQNLDFLTKGLKAHFRFTIDNAMSGTQYISDATGNDANVKYKYFDPATGEWVYSYPIHGDYAYAPAPWILSDFKVGGNKLRHIDYEFAVNYQRTFNEKHSVSGLFLFKRQQHAIGNMFPRYNEDWVFRATYDYKKKYLIEANGAYNGSEKFGDRYRFDFFPSVGLGWVISNENFMKKLHWVDRIKLRASLGSVGDDNFTNARWLYMSQWVNSNYHVAINNPGFFGPHLDGNAKSPYGSFDEKQMGNEDIHWEKAFKQDYGLEFSFLNGLVSGEFDYFIDRRKDIFIPGSQRAANDLIGIQLPGANLGEVKVDGFEATLNLNHTFNNGLNLFGNFNFSHAKDVVLKRDEPQLRPGYQKQEGFAIGQIHAPIVGGIMQSWDDVYMSTPLANGDNYKRVGYFDVIDFNGDGFYSDQKDIVPFGFPTRPRNTWSATFGGGLKGFELTVQFYGQYNSTRVYSLRAFSNQTHIYFKEYGDYWSKDNPDGKYTLRPVKVSQGAMDPLLDHVDASIVRLKLVELAYRLPQKACSKIGLKGLRFYVSGNNLCLWSHMADDRDFGGGNEGGYPTMKRFNVGININL